MYAKPYLILTPFFLAACADVTPTPQPVAPQTSSVVIAPHTSSGAAAQQIELDNKIAQAALQVAELIDQNRAGEVWDGASALARSHVSRDDFVQQAMTDRQAVGAPVARRLTSVKYQEGDGRALPVGLYASADFTSQFARAQQGIRELVSFHLDSDGTWRVTGYAVGNKATPK